MASVTGRWVGGGGHDRVIGRVNRNGPKGHGMEGKRADDEDDDGETTRIHVRTSGRAKRKKK